MNVGIYIHTYVYICVHIIYIYIEQLKYISYEVACMPGYLKFSKRVVKLEPDPFRARLRVTHMCVCASICHVCLGQLRLFVTHDTGIFFEPRSYRSESRARSLEPNLVYCRAAENLL